MKRYVFIAIFAIFSSWSTIVLGQLPNNDLQVSFDFEKIGNRKIVEPMCLNNTGKEVVLSYRYEFKKINMNKPDIMPISQFGMLKLLPGEEKTACRLEAPAPGYQLDFYLYENGERVGIYSISRHGQ